ncbi:MAG: ATP-binding protein [Anaerolineales bacterium]|nr:ATP-binding protein [Anaerolineales bacterium]
MHSEAITIHATYDDILIPSAHLRELLTVHQISEDIIKSCETALNELLKQIIEYVCNGDIQKTITVNIACNASGVYIETQDEGNPVEFAVNKLIKAKNLQPASQDDSELDQEDMLDELWYELDTGKNIWQLVKYL